MMDQMQSRVNRLYLAIIRQAAKDIAHKDCTIEEIETAVSFLHDSTYWDNKNAIDNFLLAFIDAKDYDGLYNYLQIIK